MVRIVVLEKRLQHRVDFVRAITRTPDSWYYKINPSGRVPYLVLDDGVGIEESTLIIRHLDHGDGNPVFGHPDGAEGWEFRRLEARAKSLIDGLSVWSREMHRPPEDQSSTIIAHERERARRLTNWWETSIDHPLMNGPLNVAQITLICALKIDRVNIQHNWRGRCPKLDQWAIRLGKRPSLMTALPNENGNFFDPANQDEGVRVSS